MFPRPVHLSVCLIIWYDSVKIPLTVNENKLYVLAEIAKLENVSKSALNTRGEFERARTIENHAALGIRSSKKAVLQKSLTSLTLDNANQNSINPDDRDQQRPELSEGKIRNK